MKNNARLVAAIGLAMAPAAYAQDPRVTANDPASVVAALEMAGYQPKLSKDGIEDPMIEVKISDYSSRIYFYGCDKDTHQGCDTLMLSTGFDRKKPWTHDNATAMMKDWRFASVYLDDEGDPYVTYDIVTLEGMPTKLFLASVSRYGDALAGIADKIFADE